MGLVSLTRSILSALATLSVLSGCGGERARDFPEPEGAALLYDVGDTVYVTASGLNVRDAPRQDGRIVDRLSRGASVRISGRSTEWLKISDLPRWVSANHVSSASPSTPQHLLQPVSGTSKRSYQSQSLYHAPARQEPSRRAWVGKTCKKGKPCGNACIAQHRTCHK